ncbi:RES domain-containing protein [Sphingomonas beigongshangi]|uniref:RES domain-containing protein n=1 Tax=Sphingomonas beigongshangi TaxID=2782540 RepID=UPI00193B2BA9|nr:RES domain-containing protein [Sphingomonas beigongshangi]
MSELKIVDRHLYVIDRLRSIADYKKLHEQWRDLIKADKSNVPDSELKDLFDRFAVGYVTRRLSGVPMTSFRARSDESLDPAAPWSHVSQLLAKPAQYCSIGRFNRAGQSMLYVSSSPFISLAEIRARPDSHAVVLVLKYRKRESCVYAQVGLQRLPQFGTIADRMTNARGGLPAESTIRKFLQKRGTYEQWRAQDFGLSEIALRMAPAGVTGHYNLSNILAEALLQLDEVRGFYYPTVQAGYRGVNIAAPVDTAMEDFAPFEAWLVKLDSTPNLLPNSDLEPHQPIVVRRGSCHGDGCIEWGASGTWPLAALHREIAPI